MTQALWRRRAIRILATVAAASVATLWSGQPGLASVSHSARVACGPVVTQPLADESWDLGAGQAPAATGELLGYTLVTGSRYTTDAPPVGSATPRGTS